MGEANAKRPNPKFIKAGSMLVQVLGTMKISSSGKPIWTPDMVLGKGYIHRNHVWVFKNDVTSAPYPIAYLDPHGRSDILELIKPTDAEFEKWELDKIVGNDFDDARRVDANRIILSPDVIEAMNNATSSYTPTIEENDDFLKRLVKTAIRTKDVDLNRLKAKLSKSYGLSNLKSALKGTTKMSVNAFKTWMILLGLDFTVVVDGGKGKDGEKVLFEYNSETDKVRDPHGAERETNEREDFLKRIVRLLIADKNVESSTLKSKMTKTYGFSNLVQALNGSTKMSVNGFLTWLDLLDSAAEFEVYDNGLDRLTPLPETLYYSTSVDKITDKDGKEVIIYDVEDDEETE